MGTPFTSGRPMMLTVGALIVIASADLMIRFIPPSISIVPSAPAPMFTKPFSAWMLMFGTGTVVTPTTGAALMLTPQFTWSTVTPTCPCCAPSRTADATGGTMDGVGAAGPVDTPVMAPASATLGGASGDG